MTNSAKGVFLTAPDTIQLIQRIDVHHLDAGLVKNGFIGHPLPECGTGCGICGIPIGMRCLQKISFVVQYSEVHAPAVYADAANLRTILQNRFFNSAENPVKIPEKAFLRSDRLVGKAKNLLRHEVVPLGPGEHAADRRCAHINGKHLFHFGSHQHGSLCRSENGG